MAADVAFATSLAVVSMLAAYVMHQVQQPITLLILGQIETDPLPLCSTAAAHSILDTESEQD